MASGDSDLHRRVNDVLDRVVMSADHLGSDALKRKVAHCRATAQEIIIAPSQQKPKNIVVWDEASAKILPLSLALAPKRPGLSKYAQLNLSWCIHKAPIPCPICD